MWGRLALGSAVAFTVWALLAALLGGSLRRNELVVSARRALWCAAAAAVLALGLLARAILTGDLSVAYVVANTASNIPLPYGVAALWAAPAGALLMCGALTAVCAALALTVQRQHDGGQHTVVAAVVVGTMLGLALVAQPFAATIGAPMDGQGLIPALQTPGMLLQPPLLMLAVGCSAIPLALALTVGIDGQEIADAMAPLRAWLALSWGLMTLAGASGVWWGYTFTATNAWLSDPVRTGLVWPWMALTIGGIGAFVVSHRRAMIAWVVIPACLAWPLAIGALVIATGGAVHGAGGGAVEVVRIGSAALVGVVALIATALWSNRAVLSQRVTSGTGLGPRGLPRVAALVSVGGAFVLLCGLAGHLLRASQDLSLAAGASATLRDPAGRPWRFTAVGPSRFESLNRYVFSAGLIAEEGGRSRGGVASEERQFMNAAGEDTFDAYLLPGIVREPAMDVRVLMSVQSGSDVVDYRIAFEPFAPWIWWGSALWALGGILMGWSRRSADAGETSELLSATANRRVIP